MEKNGKYRVTRKSDGKKLYVNQNAYYKISLSRSLLEISVDNIEGEMEEGKIVSRTPSYSTV